MVKQKGSGWHNESRRHSLARRGIKTAQKIPLMHITKSQFTEVEKDFKEEYGDDYNINDLKKFFKEQQSSKIESFEEGYDGDIRITLEDGTEWRVFKDEETAERVAEDRVREDLENEPELFNQDWLNNYYTMSDTDRRLLADDLTQNYASDIRDEDNGERLAEESGYKDEFDEIQEKIDELDLDAKNYDEKIDYLEKQKEELLDKAEEELREKMYDETYEELADPYDYLVNQQGLYTPEDYFKSGLVSIDIEDAVEGAINEDGWQHFMFSYDGNSYEAGDMVLVRDN